MLDCFRWSLAIAELLELPSPPFGRSRGQHALAPAQRRGAFPTREGAVEGVEFFEPEQERDLAAVELGRSQQLASGLMANLVAWASRRPSAGSSSSLSIARHRLKKPAVSTRGFGPLIRFGDNPASRSKAAQSMPTAGSRLASTAGSGMASVALMPCAAAPTAGVASGKVEQAC